MQRAVRSALRYGAARHTQQRLSQASPLWQEICSALQLDADGMPLKGPVNIPRALKAAAHAVRQADTPQTPLDACILCRLAGRLYLHDRRGEAVDQLLTLLTTWFQGYDRRTAALPPDDTSSLRLSAPQCVAVIHALSVIRGTRMQGALCSTSATLGMHVGRGAKLSAGQITDVLRGMEGCRASPAVRQLLAALGTRFFSGTPASVSGVVWEDQLLVVVRVYIKHNMIREVQGWVRHVWAGVLSIHHVSLPVVHAMLGCVAQSSVWRSLGVPLGEAVMPQLQHGRICRGHFSDSTRRGVALACLPKLGAALLSLAQRLSVSSEGHTLLDVARQCAMVCIAAHIIEGYRATKSRGTAKAKRARDASRGRSPGWPFLRQSLKQQTPVDTAELLLLCARLRLWEGLEECTQLLRGTPAALRASATRPSAEDAHLAATVSRLAALDGQKGYAILEHLLARYLRCLRESPGAVPPQLQAEVWSQASWLLHTHIPAWRLSYSACSNQLLASLLASVSQAAGSSTVRDMLPEMSRFAAAAWGVTASQAEGASGSLSRAAFDCTVWGVPPPTPPPHHTPRVSPTESLPTRRARWVELLRIMADAPGSGRKHPEAGRGEEPSVPEEAVRRWLRRVSLGEVSLEEAEAKVGRGAGHVEAFLRKRESVMRHRSRVVVEPSQMELASRALWGYAAAVVPQCCGVVRLSPEECRGLLNVLEVALSFIALQPGAAADAAMLRQVLELAQKARRRGSVSDDLRWCFVELVVQRRVASTSGKGVSPAPLVLPEDLRAALMVESGQLPLELLKVAIHIAAGDPGLLDVLSGVAASFCYTPDQIAHDGPAVLRLFAQARRLPAHALALSETLYHPLREQGTDPALLREWAELQG